MKKVPTFEEWMMLGKASQICARILSSFAQKQGVTFKDLVGITPQDEGRINEKVHSFITTPQPDTGFILWFLLESAYEEIA